MDGMFFFVRSGYIEYSIAMVAMRGLYWSSTPRISPYIYYLDTINEDTSPNRSHDTRYGISLRCLAI